MANNTTNKHAHVRRRFDRNGKLRVETHRRDNDSIKVAATLDRRAHSTRFFIDLPEGMTVRLSGREMRTLYTVLSHFYDAKSALDFS